MRKRIVFIADLHSGHRFGLTPPGYQYGPPWPEDEYERARRRKCADVQQKVWSFYAGMAERLQPTDPNMELSLVVNGDCCDGKGARNAGKELLAAMKRTQCAMAVEAIQLFQPDHIYMAPGTGYHVGLDDDWEEDIADKVNADEFKDMLSLDVNGLLFNVRHKTSRSVNPHGRTTILLRQRIWEVLWADWEERKAAHVLIRGHVHYHTYAGGPDHLVMTNPALEVYSEYGVRQCEGIIHVGLLWFDVEENGDYSWNSEIMKGKIFKSPPILV